MGKTIEAIAKVLIYFPLLMVVPIAPYGIRLDLMWQLAVAIFCVFEIIIKLRTERNLLIAFIFILLITLLTLQHRNLTFSDFGFVSGILALPLTLYILKRIRFENFNLSIVRIQFALFLIVCVLIMVFQSFGFNFVNFYGLKNTDLYTLIVGGGRFIGPFGLPTEAAAIGLLSIAAGLSVHSWYLKLVYIGAGFLIAFLVSSKIFLFGIILLFFCYLWRILSKEFLFFLLLVFGPFIIYFILQSSHTRFNLDDGKIVRGLTNYTENILIGGGFFGLDRGTDSIFLAVLLGGGILGFFLFMLSLIICVRDLSKLVRKHKGYFYIGGVLISFGITLPGTFIVWTERVCFILMVVIVCLSDPKRPRESH